MTGAVHTDICYKEILWQKKVFFWLICLHFHLIDHIGKQTIWEKIFFSFNYFFERALIFHFKDVFRKADREVVMEPVFSADGGFEAKLCLWGPPQLINLIQTWCTNLGMAQNSGTVSSHPLREKLR